MGAVSQSRSEEVANTVSHLIGFLAALAGIPILVVHAVREGDAASVVATSVFGASLALLFLASTVYHALPIGRAKRAFRRLDHVAIFILIAGTYTPFTLGILRGVWGWTLFGLVWGIAALGIVLKVVSGPRHPRLSLAIYLAMGWMVLLAVRPLLEALPPWGWTGLVLGGLLYTGGVPFYLSKRLRYSHFIWHLFVLAGATCHFLSVLHYAV